VRCCGSSASSCCCCMIHDGLHGLRAGRGGQMSFWAATVITKPCFSAIPGISGEPIVTTGLWGRLLGRQSDPSTASTRCNYLLPFVIARALGRAGTSGRCTGRRPEQKPPTGQSSRVRGWLTRVVAFHALCHHQGRLSSWSCFPGSFSPGFRVLTCRASSGHPGQLHPGQSGGCDADAHRAGNGTTCRSTPSCGAESRTSLLGVAARSGALDRDPRVPAVGSTPHGFARAALSSALPAVTSGCFVVVCIGLGLARIERPRGKAGYVVWSRASSPALLLSRTS